MKKGKWEFKPADWNFEKATVKLAELKSDPEFIKAALNSAHPDHQRVLEFQLSLYNVVVHAPAEDKPMRVANAMEKILVSDGMSKDEAKIWIKTLQIDPKFCDDYVNSGRPGHNLAKEKMAALYQIAYPDGESAEHLDQD
jgi:hypothetical protein